MLNETRAVTRRCSEGFYAATRAHSNTNHYIKSILTSSFNSNYYNNVFLFNMDYYWLDIIDGISMCHWSRRFRFEFNIFKHKVPNTF